MTRANPLKVVTANDLLTGRVVYRTPDDGWSADLADAELLASAARADLRRLQADAESHIVVGAYLADVAAGAAGPVPVHRRDAFRASGPSTGPRRDGEARHV